MLALHVGILVVRFVDAKCHDESCELNESILTGPSIVRLE